MCVCVCVYMRVCVWLCVCVSVVVVVAVAVVVVDTNACMRSVQNLLGFCRHLCKSSLNMYVSHVSCGGVHL